MCASVSNMWRRILNYIGFCRFLKRLDASDILFCVFEWSTILGICMYYKDRYNNDYKDFSPKFRRRVIGVLQIDFILILGVILI